MRELQHFIERSVVISTGKVLQAPVAELERLIEKRQTARRRSTPGRTLHDIERESILQALKESDWVVGGPNGAAARLGLKRTTLASRMQKLGIWRRRRE
ncbi:MAG TPA: helix-turn-helix domain-containing protein [Terriglobales bacterium]|nr:helix-turn-helix domain-containing protein [Terriglobales bacterium]